MLEIKNINVKSILKDISLTINDGETHVIMGPNGAGKSTLCKALMHHPQYEITNGTVFYQGKDITFLKTSEIAKQGLYYISQTPIEIEGITNVEMLRTALFDKGQTMDIFSFNKKCQEICQKLDLPKSFLHRYVNEGMSGGERKKNELFGMWLLEPSLLILDEIDSGLDVDALKIVGNNIAEYQALTGASVLVVTHQQKLIDILNPSFVHIMKDGQIVDEGDLSLAKEVLKTGFSQYEGTNVISKDHQDE